MHQKSSSKSIYIVVGVLIVFAIGYFYFQGSKPVDNGALQELVPTDDVAARVVSLLNQIQSLKIDATFFDDEAYQSLIDHTQQIPEVPVGRPNPFAPLPGGAVSSTTRR